MRASSRAFFLFVFLIGGMAEAGEKPRRPNIVVILSDDQGWGDLSINGNKSLKTPNIDALARRGAIFDRFYVQPVCSPTRAEFLTGRYHPRSGVRGVSTGLERMNLGEVTIAQILRALGYRTGMIGKWHNGSQWPYHPNARGFEDYYGFTSGHWGEYFDAPLEHNGKPVRGKGYIADDFTDKAIAFIEKHQAEPFFCYVAYNTPHSPFCVPDEDWNRFKDRPIEQRGADGKKEDLAVTRCVLAMCENLDRNVGRILRKLEELNLAEDTIVIFFSDNGPNSFRWNGGMRGRKGSTDEGGVRSPCVIRWPGKIAPGTVIPQIAGAIDLLPTLTGLAKAPLPQGKALDGRDLSPLLLGKKVDWPERMIFSSFAGKVSVRTQQYRLDANGLLYDMSADSGQTKDVAEKHPEMAGKLRQAAADWRKEMFTTKKDDRPFPVGFAEFPITPLPARDGVAQGGIRRSAGAPNCSYFTNWKSKEDAITWDIEVNTPGTYRAEVLYTCRANDVGSVIELRFKDAKATGKVAPAWDPVLLDKQDRVPRKGESFQKEFRTLALAPITLAKGRGALTLRALEIPGEQVMDVRRYVDAGGEEWSLIHRRDSAARSRSRIRQNAGFLAAHPRSGERGYIHVEGKPMPLNRSWVAVALVAGLLVAVAAAGDAGASKVHGTWTGSSLGQTVTLTFGPKNAVKIRVGKDGGEGTYSVDLSKSPAHLDIDFGKRGKVKTIIELTDDNLKLEDVNPGSKERPTMFNKAVLLKRDKVK